MPAARDPYSALDPESEERKEMRAQGLAPVARQRLDTSDPEFIAEARRRAQEIANCPHEDEELDFIESISILLEEWDEIDE